MSPPTDRLGFYIAIICAMPIESNAVDLLFDELYDDAGPAFGKAPGDTNKYKTGRLGKHHIVLLTLPSIGPQAATAGSAQMIMSFPNIQFGLIVGVCGGLPQINNKNAFLGDVVVSTSLLNYDFGTQYTDHFAVKFDIQNTLGPPSSKLQSLLSFLEREHDMGRLKESAAKNLGQLQARASEKRRKANYKSPSHDLDLIFPSDYEHIDRKEDCAECDATPRRFCEPVTRKTCDDAGCEDDRQVCRGDARREQLYAMGYATGLPQIFLGKVACGNAVMMSGRHRDQKAKEHDIIAFEMEGAGAWEVLSCLVVKGICDYADSHKNKHWQNFAAATAASVAVAILEQYEPPDDMTGRSGASRQGPVTTVTHNYGGQSGNSHNILGSTFGSGTTINMGG
ncbi:hypothetical protein GGTG_09260 [Gaeumannomyces tritici R3-111a-1]|uniref:Nucleoside phosphorylase domain-containing protein n=1 Tax=Gaeumannomyces tritici (strain R3-111a-1) TaxID=644352 RepID=J3P6W8_GAET3|nr:hypothetical protein GGTG_09260 [Gaeumannomyces tritici R3-111a-1]EJT72394.1 hypothetical protein GGTG_09260 [Gaeumannomyces tritici R3-111a-1]